MSLWRRGQDHDGIAPALRAAQDADDARAVEADVREAHGQIFVAQLAAYALSVRVRKARQAGAVALTLSCDEVSALATAHLGLADLARQYADRREQDHPNRRTAA